MGSFFAELRRRHIYRIGAGYVVVAWAVAQLIDLLSQTFALPDWIAQPVLIVLAVGLPLTLVNAWIAEGRKGASEPASAPNPVGVVDWILFGGLTTVLIVIGYQQLSPSDLTVARVGVQPNSIAVLPFENLSLDPENASFTDGFHGQLLTQLYKISALRVISRTSVMEYRDSPKNIRDIGMELDVATILEGNVQRAGDDLQINVQLINADTDETIWAETYDRDASAEGILAIQREMATSVASTLQATLTPEETALIRDVPTDNVRAYDFYLSGNDYFWRAGIKSENVPLAVEMYSRATQEDPNFALAWAGLSQAHSEMNWWGIDRTDQRRELALEAARRSLELAPALPEAHFALAEYFYRAERDYARALIEYEISSEGLPGSAEIIGAEAFIQRRLGYWDRSIANLERAIELDPRNIVWLQNQASSYARLRKYTQADQYYERALNIEPTDELAYFSWATIPLAREGSVERLKTALDNAPIDFGTRASDWAWTAAIYERDYDRALQFAERSVQDNLSQRLSSIQSARGRIHRATAYSLSGDVQRAQIEARNAAAELEELIEEDGTDPQLHLDLGEAYANLNERELAVDAAKYAMDLLPESVDAFLGPSYQIDAIVRILVPVGEIETALTELDDYLGSPALWSIEGLLPDPRLDPIRDDPRFIALVEKYRRQ